MCRWQVLGTQVAEVAAERDEWQQEARSGRQRLAATETAVRGRDLELRDQRRAYEVPVADEHVMDVLYTSLP